MSPTARRADFSGPQNRSGILLVLSTLLVLVMLSYVILAADVSYLALVRTQLHAVAGAACLATTLVSNIPVPLFFVPVRAKPEGSGSRKTP